MSDGITILLIDDDTRQCEFYAGQLQVSSSNYDIAFAVTGRAGLDICERQPIDCVVLEIDLPDVSGFTVLSTLVPRASHPEIAVIVLTRLPNPFLLELAIKNGAQAAFHKTTVSGDQLEKSILKAISTVRKRLNGNCS
jgi:PleD family two-component response regulator